MRIANVIEEGKLGGPQVRMVRVAAAMAEGETLIVMPSANSAPFRALCDENRVPYRTLPMTRITKEWRVALGYLLLSPVEVLRLLWIFKREQIDLVHASGGSWQYKALLAARLAGIPSVWHLNDTQMPCWVRRVFSLFAPLADAFIFASQRSREYYGGRLEGRLQDVIPSTVDASQFDPEQPHPGDTELLRRLGNAPVLGTIANINPIKGIETLLRAAAALRTDVPALKVVVVGAVHPNQQGYYAQLVALARELGLADAIEWIGARSDVRPLLARFDIYVCSSLAESSPVSVWEAMAMARPVVSTDVGDVARELVDGESGFVVRVGDYSALADRARCLLADSELARRFGARARARAIRHFSPARIAEKTVELYRRVLTAPDAESGMQIRKEDTPSCARSR